MQHKSYMLALATAAALAFAGCTRQALKRQIARLDLLLGTDTKIKFGLQVAAGDTNVVVVKAAQSA